MEKVYIIAFVILLSSNVDSSTTSVSIFHDSAKSPIYVNTTTATLLDDTISNPTYSPTNTASTNNEENSTRPDKSRLGADFFVIFTGSVSKSQYDRAKIYILPIVKPFISTVAIIGSTLIIATISKFKNKHSADIYLEAFAVTNILFILATTISDVPYYMRELGLLELSLYTEAVLFAPLVQFLKRTWVTWSDLLMITMALERFFAVVVPFKVRFMLLSRWPKLVVLFLCVLTHLIFAPSLFRYEIQKATDSQTNTSFYIIGKSSIAKSTNFYTVYFTVMPLLMQFVPAVALMFLNISIIVRVRLASRERRAMQMYSESSLSTEDWAKTKVLLTITVMYSLMEIPSALTSVVAKFHDTYRFYGKEHYLYLLIYEVIESMRIAFAAVQIIPLIVLSQKFNKQLYALCRCSKQTGVLKRGNMIHHM